MINPDGKRIDHQKAATTDHDDPSRAASMRPPADRIATTYPFLIQGPHVRHNAKNAPCPENVHHPAPENLNDQWMAERNKPVSSGLPAVDI